MGAKNANMQSMKNVQNHYELCKEFKSGMYEASMTVYELKKQVPRIVAAEFFWLEDIVKLKVGKESSVFRIFTNKNAESKELWYLLDGSYIKAKRNRTGYELPVSALELQQESGWPFVEGTVKVVFAEKGHDPEPALVREMKIHLAKPCVDMTDVLELLERTE